MDWFMLKLAINLKTCRREKEDMMSPSGNQPYGETVSLRSFAPESFTDSLVTGVIFGLLLYHASWQQKLNSVHMKLVPLDFIPTN